MTFSEDNTFSDITTEYDFGDGVFTRILINGDIGNYRLFGVVVEQCYVCTSNVSDDTTNNLETCLTRVVDTSLFYIIHAYDDGLDFTIIEKLIFHLHYPLLQKYFLC